MKRALRFYDRGHLDKSIQQLYSALAADWMYADGYLLRARISVERKDYSLAASDYEHAIYTGSTSKENYKAMVVLYLQGGACEYGDRRYKKAVALYPELECDAEIQQLLASTCASDAE